MVTVVCTELPGGGEGGQKAEAELMRAKMSVSDPAPMAVTEVQGHSPVGAQGGG